MRSINEPSAIWEVYKERRAIRVRHRRQRAATCRAVMTILSAATKTMVVLAVLYAVAYIAAAI